MFFKREHSNLLSHLFLCAIFHWSAEWTATGDSSCCALRAPAAIQWTFIYFVQGFLIIVQFYLLKIWKIHFAPQCISECGGGNNTNNESVHWQRARDHHNLFIPINIIFCMCGGCIFGVKYCTHSYGGFEWLVKIIFAGQIIIIICCSDIYKYIYNLHRIYIFAGSVQNLKHSHEMYAD